MLDRNRKVLLTAAGPHMQPLLTEFALPTFRRYATTFGYEVVAVELPPDGPERLRETPWLKIQHLRQQLTRAGHVLWLDADVMIMRPSHEDIITHLPPGAFQGLVIEQIPERRRVNPNSGVWLMRHSHEAFRFLDELSRLGQQPGLWADQGAILKALGWDLGDERHIGARPGLGSPFLHNTAWLPSSWNQIYAGNPPRSPLDGMPQVADPHIVHFANMPLDERRRLMGAHLRRALG